MSNRPEVFSMSQFDSEFAPVPPIHCDECGARIPETATDYCGDFKTGFICGKCAETVLMSKSEYYERMRACGFPDHEIDICWGSEDRIRILDAAIADGERDLSASAEEYQ